MHKQKREAARPRKSPAAQAITIKLPAAITPILAACVAHNETTPEQYALDATICSLRCDTSHIGIAAKQVLDELERGQE